MHQASQQNAIEKGEELFQKVSMRKKLLISIAGLALSITLKPIPTTGQQSAGPPSAELSKQQQGKTEDKDPTSGNVQQPVPDRAITINGTIRVLGEPTAEPQPKKTTEQAQGFWGKAIDGSNAPDWGLVILAGVAAWYARRAFIATRKQADAADKMLLLTHRPKLIVRHIVIPEMVKMNRQTPMNQLTDTLTGYYRIANTGGMPATIRRINEGVWTGTLPMERPHETYPGRSIDITIAPGESKKVAFEKIQLPSDDAVDLIGEQTEAYFLVTVEYVDKAGIVRETGSCRKYDRTMKRFIAVQDSDYEYAD